MSEPLNDPIEPPPREPAGCMPVLVGIAGAIMLLPGLCALILVGLDPHEMTVDATWALWMLIMLAIGAAGIALIWWAFRRRRAGGGKVP
jgi:drug/metabolite transporter (DMT)-like permease